MSVSVGILMYAMLWVVILFLVLPWGVRVSDRLTPGHAESAPENPRIGLKLLLTSILAGMVWGGVFLILMG